MVFARLGQLVHRLQGDATAEITCITDSHERKLEGARHAQIVQVDEAVTQRMRRFAVRILRVTSETDPKERELRRKVLDACLRDKAKLHRAYGGCLGSQRRRRTWTAAISPGEPLTGHDPGISEWGNPNGV